MDLLKNIAGFVFFVAVILPVVGYYPITFLIALWQVEQTKNWETTRCAAICGSSKTKATIGYERKYWINYGFQSRLEPPKMPPFDWSSMNKLPAPDRNLSPVERMKRVKENMAKWGERAEAARQKDKEAQEKYDREREIYDREEEKLRSGGTKYFSIFQINGWRYWGSYGWKEICNDERGNARKPRFETDCYIDPNDPEKAVLYRKLGLNWAWTILLILNFLLMFGFLRLAVHLFRYDLRRDKRKRDAAIVPGMFGN